MKPRLYLFLLMFLDAILLIGWFIFLCILFALTFSAISSYGAHAEAPEVGSPQYEMLMPYSNWVRRQVIPHADSHGNIYGCCSLADCREVDVRTDADGAHIQAFIDSKNFPGGPDKWLDVPDAVLLHDHAPDHPPFPVACWIASRAENSGFYCLSLGVTF
jgi:hypothetical protein